MARVDNYKKTVEMQKQLRYVFGCCLFAIGVLSAIIREIAYLLAILTTTSSP